MIFIDCSDQPLDFSFHASSAIVAAALVDGTVEIHSYPSACLHDDCDASSSLLNDDDEEQDTIVASLDMMDGLDRSNNNTSCRAIQFSAHHHTSRIYAAGNNGTLKCWDLETNDRRGKGLMDGRIVWAIQDTTHPIQIMAQCTTMSTGSAHLLFTGDDHGKIRIYDTRLCTLGKITDAKTPPGCVLSCNPCHSDYISGLQPITDGSLLFSSSADGTWALHDLRKSSDSLKSKDVLFQSDIMDDDELLSLWFVEESQKVFCGTTRGVVKAWTRSGVSSKHSNSNHPSSWTDVDFTLDPSSYLFHHPPHHSIDSILSMDRETLITGCSDGLIRFFNISSHQFIGVLNPSDEAIKPEDTTVHELVSAGKGYPIERLDFTLEKKFIASLSHDNFIRFYSLQDDEERDDDCIGDEEDDDETKGQDESDSNPSIDSDESSKLSHESSSSDNESYSNSKKNKRFKTDSDNFFKDL